MTGSKFIALEFNARHATKFAIRVQGILGGIKKDSMQTRT